MLLYDLATDGEPEPDSAVELISAPVEVIETVEDARQILFRDADALILNRDQHVCVIFVQVDLHVAALGAELDGIIYQRHKRPLEGLRVAPDRWQVRAGSETQTNVAILGGSCIPANDRVTDLVHIHFLKVWQNQIHFLEEEEIIDKGHNLLDVARDGVDSCRQLFALENPFLQNL